MGILYKSRQISNSPLVDTCRLCNLPTLVFHCTNHLHKEGHSPTETRRTVRVNKHSHIRNFKSAVNGSCVQFCSKNWHLLTSHRKVAKPSWSTLTRFVYKNIQRTIPPEKKKSSDLSFTSSKTLVRWYVSCKLSAWAPDPTCAPLCQTLQQTEHPFDVNKAYELYSTFPVP